MTVTNKKKTQLQALTGLRFFAAIYVILFHHAVVPLSIFPNYISNLASYGYTSVSLFFVLSGFILAYNYLDPRQEKHINPQRFWIARFARIYPMYIFALILSTPSFISKFTGNLSFLEAIRAIFTGTTALALLQAWTPWTATAWNTPGWSLSAEVFFYFLFPFIATHIARLDNRRILILSCMLWLTALVAPFLYLLSQLNSTGATTEDSGLWIQFISYCPLFHLPQFLIGVCGGLIFLRKNSSLSKIVLFYSRSFLYTGIAFILLVVLFATSPKIPYVLLNNGCLSPLFILIIYALAHGKGIIAKFLSLPTFLVLGEASYAMYLLQNPLLSLMKRLAIKAGDIRIINSSFFNSFPFLLIYLITLAGISVGTFYIIETPLKKPVAGKLYQLFKISKIS